MYPNFKSDQIHLFKIKHKTVTESSFETIKFLENYGISKHRIIKNSFGKPLYIGNLNNLKHLNFNITHTSEYSIILLTSLSFAGIDAEKASNTKVLIKSYKNIFSEKELSFIKKLNKKEQNFQKYRLWTVKEAFLKALGIGLYIPPNIISVQNFDKNPSKIKVENPKLFDFFMNKTYEILNINNFPNFLKLKNAVALNNTWFTNTLLFSDESVCSAVYLSDKALDMVVTEI